MRTFGWSSRLVGAVLAGAIGLVACGGEDSNVESARLALVAGATSASSLSVKSGTRVDIPAGASSENMTIVLTTAPASRRAPTGAVIVGTPIVLEPEGATFDKALSITMPIEPSKLPAGTTIDDVVVYTTPQATDAFVPLPTRRSGTAVVADTTHFSYLVAVVFPIDGGVGTDSGASVDGGVDAGDGGLPAPNGLLHMFRTSSFDEVPPVFASPAAADALCNSNRDRPTSGVYKAAIVGSQRRACASPYCATDGGTGTGAIDWVLAPNTTYYTGSVGSEVAWRTTNAVAIFDTPVLNPPTCPDCGSYAWSGLGPDFTNKNTCADWTSSAFGQFSSAAELQSDTYSGTSDLGCTYYSGLVCFEQ